MTSEVITTPNRAKSPGPKSRNFAWRYVFLALGGIALLTGLNAGLRLFSLPAPLSADRIMTVHGELMVFGFLGSVIALERAVAFRKWWGYTAPLGLSVGSLILLSPLPLTVGRALQTLGMAVLVATYVMLWQRAKAQAVLVQGLGAVLALGALIMLAGGSGFALVMPWLAGFIFLTIGGERVELARVAIFDSRFEDSAAVASIGFCFVSVSALLWPTFGVRMFAVLVLICMAGLVKFDVARRTIRSTGLPRFSATCILFGYFWLTVAAASWLINGPQSSGPGYDLVIHATFLGFAMSMVMGHAPIIFPAVIRRPLPYHQSMWVAVALLQVSLALRIVGDLRGVFLESQIGAALNVAAILLFVIVTVTAVVRGKHS